MKNIAFLMFLASFHLLAVGQNNQLETDKGIAASIAPYEADVRQAILQASLYPQVLTTLQKSQSQSVASFQKAIKGYRQSKQVYFYTLTRYPDLLHKLATLPDGQSKEDVYKLLPNTDKNLQTAAWELYSGEKKKLVVIDNIRISTEQDFDKTIQNLDPQTKSAFKKLEVLPDVLILLTNNIDLTTRLGEHYKIDPRELNDRLAAIHDSLNVQNQYETAALQKQVADDPKASAELSQAATDYATENGYDPPTQQNDEMDQVGAYYDNSYSYWFGYPYWYGTPVWYPGAFWYESGFYLGIGGFGFYGFPSYGFGNWFFHGGRYNRYPNLYRQFGNYYRGNVAGNRFMGGANHGFMSVANNHFNPRGGAQLNRLTSPSSYKRPAGESINNSRVAARPGGNTARPAGNTTHSNANSYHSQSWGSYGGRGNSVGGGSRGGGFGGGGSRGGGRR